MTSGVAYSNWLTWLWMHTTTPFIQSPEPQDIQTSNIVCTSHIGDLDLRHWTNKLYIVRSLHVMLSDWQMTSPSHPVLNPPGNRRDRNRVDLLSEVRLRVDQHNAPVIVDNWIPACLSHCCYQYRAYSLNENHAVLL